MILKCHGNNLGYDQIWMNLPAGAMVKFHEGMLTVVIPQTPTQPPKIGSASLWETILDDETGDFWLYTDDMTLVAEFH